MMAHHFITSALVISSFMANFTRIGTAILVEQVILGTTFLSLALFL